LLGYTTSDFHCENSQVPQNPQIFPLSNAHTYVDETNTQNCALQALSRAWIASNALENLESACLLCITSLLRKALSA
jgi:hypothetical protein